jgi:hypothetical protein
VDIIQAFTFLRILLIMVGFIKVGTFIISVVDILEVVDSITVKEKINEGFRDCFSFARVIFLCLSNT